MEVAAWTLIIVVLMAVFKVLKFERTEAVYYEKQLLKRYLEIKKINPNYRVRYLKEWEVSVIESLEKKGNEQFRNIISFEKYSRDR